MDFEIKVLLMTFVISVVCGLITIPLLKKLKVGQIERDDGPASHLKKQGTPTMGRYNNNNFCYYSSYFRIYSVMYVRQ